MAYTTGRQSGRLTIGVLAALLLVQGVAVVPVRAADEDKKKQELLDKIRKLEEEKRKATQKIIAKEEDAKPTGQSLKEIIGRYEKILDGCAEKKSERCADVMATLGSLYYDESRDNYIRRRQVYENQMNEWEKKQIGPEPVNPIPDYSKPLKMYQRFVDEYEEHPKLYEAYYQIGNISLVLGDLDRAREAFEQLVQKFPTSRRSSAAHFRLADFAFLEHDLTKALKHIEKMNPAEVTLEVVEMSHYRKAEIYYNMGDFDQAAMLFFQYREKCESGAYRKCDFRDESLEYMAISFSDMPGGAEKAIKFFKKVGSRPYEDDVLYMIGMKNRTHGQYDDAIAALQVALKRFPYYKDAPLAQQALVECYLIKKQYEQSNEARERLIDFYSPGGEWYQKNQGQKAVIEQAEANVKRALASVAVFNHARAQKSKDKSLYEKALKRYLEFFQKFPDDKWRIYELKYNVAEIYNTLHKYAEAAQYYDFVASEDLSTYPKMTIELDTLGLDQEEIERMKKEREKQFASISQEDAGYNAIVALDNARKKAIAKAGLSEDKAYELPETKTFLAYIRKFQQRFPQSSNAADVLYLGANVHYSAKAYQAAIAEFQHIVNNYPTSPLAAKSLRLLANCYANTGDYDLALAKYRELLARTKSDSPEAQEVVDLAAGAMYKKATGMKDDGNFVGAADAFKAIQMSFPKSKVADRGWFEAGDCYEKANNLDLAAATFEQFTHQFPKSELIERAFVRAAEGYKKNNKLDAAAKVYIGGASVVTKAEYAIPSLAAAAQCYSDLQKFDQAGKTFELIYERYATDPKTPQALYNAGLLFEKANLYPQAINVYGILSQRFPNSEFSGEAFYAIGLCYEKMKSWGEMAKTFTEYAAKFPDDRYKQVEALAKAADAYYDMKKFAEAEKNYTLVTVVHKEFARKADMDLATVARAHYRLGELRFGEFRGIRLEGRNEQAVRAEVQRKTKALETAATAFAKAIEIGVEEWTVRATYMIGEGFVAMADAVAEQKLFGRKDEQVAAQIKILTTLEKYYIKAMEYFYKNIEWAYEQGVRGEYVDRSKDRFMEMAFLKGELLEKVGVLFRDAPVPPGLDKEDIIAYKELLEEKYLEALDMALPKYEEVVRAAAEVGIAQSPWLEKAKQKILSIKPDSEVLTLKIVERKTPDRAKTETKTDAGTTGQTGATGSVQSAEYDRNMRRIKNIAEMNIPLDDKIKQIGRIELEAKRNATLEEEKIRRLKNELEKASRK